VEEIERRTIRVWMRQVMSEKHMSANHWATLAGTSPTNITRFLNSDSKFLPSARTLAKLAKIAGSSPQFLNSAQQFKKIEVRNVEGDVVDMINVDDPTLQAYKLGAVTGYSMGGVMPHSYVVVRPVNNEVNDGDVLLVEDEEFGLLVGEVLGDYIIHKSSTRMVPSKPLLDQVVVGSVFQIITKLN